MAGTHPGSAVPSTEYDLSITDTETIRKVLEQHYVTRRKEINKHAIKRTVFDTVKKYPFLARAEWVRISYILIIAWDRKCD